MPKYSLNAKFIQLMRTIIHLVQKFAVSELGRTS